jgi:hypothetical protein
MDHPYTKTCTVHKISGFRRCVVTAFVFLRGCAVKVVNCWDFSGQRFGPTFKGEAVQETLFLDCLTLEDGIVTETSITSYQPTPRNILEVCKPVQNDKEFLYCNFPTILCDNLVVICSCKWRLLSTNVSGAVLLISAATCFSSVKKPSSGLNTNYHTGHYN